MERTLENKENRLFRIIMGAVRGIAVVMVSSLLWMLLFYSTTFDPKGVSAIILPSNVGLNALSLLCILGLFIWIRKKGGSVGRKCFYFFSGGYAVSNALVIFFLRLRPIDDQYYVVNVAKNLLEGKYVEFDKFGYVSLFPFQYGFIKYLELVFRVFGRYYDFVPQFLNVIYLWLAIFLIVKITGLMFGKENYAAGIGLMLFLPFEFFVTFVYGGVFR